MRVFLRVVEFFVNLLGRRKKAGKEMGNIPKDNYPMF